MKKFKILFLSKAIEPELQDRIILKVAYENLSLPSKSAIAQAIGEVVKEALPKAADHDYKELIRQTLEDPLLTLTDHKGYQVQVLGAATLKALEQYLPY